MKHPLSTLESYLVYILVWFIIIGAHVSILRLSFGFELKLAILDSTIFNGIVAVLGFSFGFAFYYLRVDSTKVNSIISYIAMVAVGAAASFFFSEYILKQTIQNADFINFLVEAKLWRFSASVFYFSMILIAYYFIFYNQDISERKQNEIRLESLLRQTELEALKSQINPHFIFNSLNSISSLTMVAPERAQEMVIKLSDFLRYSLGNNESAFSSLQEEINNINLYLDIEKVRFGDRLKIHSDINENAKKAVLPNMILQPLFENAIKYGLYESFENVEIETSAVVKNQVLNIQISNSFDPTSNVKKGKGIGLKNIKERMRIHYGSGQFLITTIDGDSFTASLDVPQNQEL